MMTHGDPYSSRFNADPGWVVVFSHVLGGSKTPHGVVDTFVPLSRSEHFWVCQNCRDLIASGILRFAWSVGPFLQPISAPAAPGSLGRDAMALKHGCLGQALTSTGVPGGMGPETASSPVGPVGVGPTHL